MDKIKEYAIRKLQEHTKVVKADTDKEKPITKLNQLVDELLNNESKPKVIYKKLLNDSIAYLIECKIIKQGDVSDYLGKLSI